jgi:hypothetical protein
MRIFARAVFAWEIEDVRTPTPLTPIAVASRCMDVFIQGRAVMFLFLRSGWNLFKRLGLAVSFALLLVPVMAHGLGDWEESTLPIEAAPLAGKYYSGDGMGYNISLELKEDGTFHAEWHGCLGKYGEAQGRWRMENWEVIFDPTMEEGAMEGHLHTLHVFDAEGNWILVAPNRVESLKTYGVDRFTAFQRTEVLEMQSETKTVATDD